MKRSLLVGACVALCAPAVAMADVFDETFPDPLSGWVGRWMFQNSDLENYYVASGNCDINNRGNNPEGLWLAEPQGCGSGTGGAVVSIDFDPAFGALLTYLEFGLEAFVQTGVTIYDMDNNALATDVFSGGDFGFGHEDIISANSANGISRFELNSTPYGSGQIEGNTSIDNIFAETIPEPGMVGALGLLALAAIRRRRS